MTLRNKSSLYRFHGLDNSTGTENRRPTVNKVALVYFVARLSTRLLWLYIWTKRQKRACVSRVCAEKFQRKTEISKFSKGFFSLFYDKIWTGSCFKLFKGCQAMFLVKKIPKKPSSHTRQKWRPSPTRSSCWPRRGVKKWIFCVSCNAFVKQEKNEK